MVVIVNEENICEGKGDEVDSVRREKRDGTTSLMEIVIETKAEAVEVKGGYEGVLGATDGYKQKVVVEGFRVLREIDQNIAVPK